MRPKALIAMSGGVDSAVTAALMKERGYDCRAVTMRLFSEYENGCCTEQDLRDAAAVAASLEIPYEAVDFSASFAEQVIAPFVAAYENGCTPNPCVECNRCLKFRALFEYAEGVDKIATGHYARVEQHPETGEYLLKKAADGSKDQSYVLYSLTREQLGKICFPLGEMTKDEVRRIAAERGFANARKRDSQDICFVPDGDYAAFLERIGEKKYPCGSFIDRNGNVLGTHNGIIRYTVGQRKGLGIAFGEPMYVTGVDPIENTVSLGREEELFSDHLTAHRINLISVREIGEPMRVRAKVRYRQPEQWATALQTDRDTLQITFDQPQRAITAGQSVVLYDGETVVGGGIIASQTNE